MNASLIDDPDSCFASTNMEVPDGIRVTRINHRLHQDTYFYQVSCPVLGGKKDGRYVLLHPDVRLNTPFDDIAMELKGNLLSSPFNLLGYLQAHVDNFPDQLLFLPCVPDVTDRPPIQDSRYAVQELYPILSANLARANAAVRMEALEDILQDIEAQCSSNPDSKLAIGCEKGKPWKLRVFCLTLQPPQQTD